MNRRALGLVIVTAVALMCPAVAGAHRLDEYLQATRLSVDRDRVGLELDLTPGVDVATQILASIDTDHDGRISPAEGDAYARSVIHEIALSIDGRSIPVVLQGAWFPETEDIAGGVGTIRLYASGAFPAASRGRHRIYYRNTHRLEVGAYLVNALVPADKQIEIDDQRRDYMQHEMTLEYRVVPDSSWTLFWLVAAGLAMAGALVVTRKTALLS
jgi:hypothetical protein